MLDYLEIFLPDMYGLFSEWIGRILQVEELQIFFGIFLLLGISGAVLRLIFH